MMKRWIARIALALLALSMLGGPVVAADNGVEEGTRIDTHLLFLNETLYPDTFEADPPLYEWLNLAYG